MLTKYKLIEQGVQLSWSNLKIQKINKIQAVLQKFKNKNKTKFHLTLTRLGFLEIAFFLNNLNNRKGPHP